MEYFLPFLLSGMLLASFVYYAHENHKSMMQMKNEVLITTKEIQQEVKLIKTDLNALQRDMEKTKRLYDDLSQAEIDMQNKVEDITSKHKDTNNQLEKLLNSEGIKRVLMPASVAHVTFHVRLEKSITSICKGQTIVFDKVVLDTRNAYNVNDGKFSVPESGIYAIYWNLMTNQVSEMDTTLVSTEGELGYGFVDKGVTSYSNGGNMVIAKLNKGSQIWLKKADSYGQYLHERFSTFSGVLLFMS